MIYQLHCTFTVASHNVTKNNNSWFFLTLLCSFSLCSQPLWSHEEAQRKPCGSWDWWRHACEGENFPPTPLSFKLWDKVWKIKKQEGQSLLSGRLNFCPAKQSTYIYAVKSIYFQVFFYYYFRKKGRGNCLWSHDPNDSLAAHYWVTNDRLGEAVVKGSNNTNIQCSWI